MILLVNPTDLANLLWNAVTISNEAKAVQGYHHVLLACEPGAPAYLYAYGMGRYAAGRARAELEGSVTESASVCITRDEASELQSQLRGLSKAKGTVVGLEIHPDGKTVTLAHEDGTLEPLEINVQVTYDGEPLLQLPDSDPEARGDVFWDRIDAAIDAAKDEPLETPVGFGLDTFKRLTNLKPAYPVVDLVPTDQERVVVARVGPDFYGILGSVDRELFAAGGEWEDGPGKPDHLIGGEA